VVNIFFLSISSSVYISFALVTVAVLDQDAPGQMTLSTVDHSLLSIQLLCTACTSPIVRMTNHSKEGVIELP